MLSSLSTLVDNLLHKNECKECESRRKFKSIKDKAWQFNFYF